MTIKVEYPNGKTETIEAVSKIESVGKLRRRRYGIDITGLVIETRRPSFHRYSFHRYEFPSIQHFEILPVKRYP